jgi:two-component system sensor histidine kinase YesM
LIYIDPEQFAATVTAGSASRPGNSLKIISGEENSLILIHGETHSSTAISEAIVDNAELVFTKSYFETSVAGNDSIVIVETQNKTGWHILGILPKAELTAAVYNTILPLAFILVIILMIGLSFSALIWRSIQKPIDTIIDFTKDVARGDFTKQLNYNSGDEMGVLSQNINGMVTRISGLFEQNRINERKRHELELEVLQYQINPHFLFNTLNSFQYIAELTALQTKPGMKL